MGNCSYDVEYDILYLNHKKPKETPVCYDSNTTNMHFAFEGEKLCGITIFDVEKHLDNEQIQWLINQQKEKGGGNDE